MESKWLKIADGWYVMLMYFRAWFCRWQVEVNFTDEPMPSMNEDYDGCLSDWYMMDLFLFDQKYR